MICTMWTFVFAKCHAERKTKISYLSNVEQLVWQRKMIRVLGKRDGERERERGKERGREEEKKMKKTDRSLVKYMANSLPFDGSETVFIKCFSNWLGLG